MKKEMCKSNTVRNKMFVNKKTSQGTFKFVFHWKTLCKKCLFVSPKRHADVHDFCIMAENIPWCMKLQKDHIAVC